MADEDLDGQRDLVKKYAKKLEVELPAFTKLLLTKEIPAHELTLDQAKKLVGALKAKATRLGVALEGPPKGGITEKQLAFIESLVARGKITHAMLTGYIKDLDKNSSIPEQLSKTDASKLIDRLTGMGGDKKKFVDDG